MIHVEIAEEKLKSIPDAINASIESVPLPNSIADEIICVGSVLNYCDVGAAIAELSRLIKSGGRLMLEFESSSGFEYKAIRELR